MKFLRDIISGKSKPSASDADQVENFETIIGLDDDTMARPAEPAPAPAPKAAAVEDPQPAKAPAPVAETPAAPVQSDAESSAIIKSLGAKLEKEPKKSAVNIWDMEDENDTVEAKTPVAAAPGPSGRRRRNKTRVLGFDGSDSAVVDLFEDAQKTKPAERTKFPVGWMLVDEGPGRGECFTLEAGMSQIGRGDDQAIQLDFGDNSISRSNHAAVVYDTESHSFTLGHGGKKNIVRLNGKPVISNEVIKTGDKIKIGETILHFVALCSEEFNWTDNGDAEESEDVAIA